MKYIQLKKELLIKDPKLDLILNTFTPDIGKDAVSDYVRLIRIIVGQQLSGAAAKTIFSRLTDLIGNNFNERDLLSLNQYEFSKVGISRAKAKYSQNISNFLLENPNFFEQLKRLNSENQITELIRFKGVGIWTASIFVMSSDIMSDVFAYGDGTLNKVIKKIYGFSDEQFDEKLEKIVINWSPYRTLVCYALWHYNDNVLTQTRNRI